MRLTRFVKGLFLYNTVYWQRASDELNPKRMSREERASLRPQRDLNVIRPREKPRAAIEAAKIVKPPENDWPEGKPPPFTPAPPVVHAEVPATAVEPAASAAPDVEQGVEIRRRKRHRRSRHGKVIPSNAQQPTGFFARFFE